MTTTTHPVHEPWEPDPHLIPAATDGRLHATKMSEPDRAYVVAVLTRRGESADRIADRLHCSARLVKRIRAEPLTQQIRRAEHAEEQLKAAVSRAESCTELRHREQQLADDATTRIRTQLDELVEQLRRTRHALDTARAQQTMNVHLHVYRRRHPTARQVENTTDPLFTLQGATDD